MDGDSKVIVSIVAAVVICIVAGIAAYSLNQREQNNRIAEMVSKGASPIAASCAISGFSGNSEREAACLMAAGKEGQK